MRIEERIVNEKTAVISIFEEIEVYNAQKLKEYLSEKIDKGYINLVINMEAIEYVDSSGLGVFVSILKKIKILNGRLIIASLRNSINQIFLLTSLDKVFEIAENSEVALSNIK